MSQSPQSPLRRLFLALLFACLLAPAVGGVTGCDSNGDDNMDEVEVEGNLE